MKKHLKLTSILLTLLMSFAIFPLTACGGKEDSVKETKIMNVSLNPQVEFILDENDKVVTVNALNEEGNLVISTEAFNNVKGMSAESAAELFIKVSKDSGFIIEGNLGDNELSVSISGDAENAKKLYDLVKNEVSSYLSSSNIDIEIEKVEAYTEVQLEELVANVSLHLSQEEIKALDYQALIKELENSRKETEGIYSQEIKNAYYTLKSIQMQTAELEAIKAKAGALISMAITTVETTYVNAANALVSARLALVEENGIYQTALSDLRAKKVEYLNYRKELSNSDVEITAEQQQVLDGLETALKSAETALTNAGEAASTSITYAEQTLQTAYDALIKAITTLGVKIEDYANDIDSYQLTASTEFNATFKTQFETIIVNAQTDWENMYAQLTVQPQE